MSSNKYILKGFFYRNIKKILIVFCLLSVIWSFGEADAFFYKILYGNRTNESYPIWNEPVIQDIQDENIEKIYNINGYRIQKKLRKKFALSAVSVYRDDNTEFWKWWFYNSGNETGRAYNRIASIDLSLAHGKTAELSNLKKFKFEHELNVLLPICKESDCYSNEKEFNNFHVIPATKSIYYGLKAVSKRKYKQIYVEGYLLDWSAVDYSDLKMKTALSLGQVSEQKYGGDLSIKCFQLYLTRLVYDGYEFK